MPGKVNPVMCEVVSQVAFQVAGNEQTISMASEAGQFELNVMELIIVFNLHESLKMMTKVMTLFKYYCIEGIEANIDKFKKDFEGTIQIISSLKPHFGYDGATKISKEAIETGESIRNLLLREKILSEVAINQILEPFEMTRPGIAGEALIQK